jgi:hypothetical protein
VANPPITEDRAAGGGPGLASWRPLPFVLVGAGALVILLGVMLRFDYDLEALLPPLPARPAPPDREESLRRTDFTPQMWAAYVSEDAGRFLVPAPRPGDLEAPFDHERIDERQVLLPGETVETRYLRIGARVEKHTATRDRGTYSTAHLVLTIENRTNRFVAYQIETGVGASPQACLRKGDVPHNAIALAPGETIKRTECVFRKGMRVTLRRIEAMAIPEISYHYVSALYPPHAGLDGRPTRGHRPTRGEPCTAIPEQAIRVGMERGTVTWRDVIDFYARHRCETYIFPAGYKAFTRKGELPLPVTAETLRHGAK